MEHPIENDGRIELRLELDRGTDPISGCITGPDGAVEEFIGWLALSGALERLMGGEAGRSGGRPASARP
jgi:hypothetical protein